MEAQLYHAILQRKHCTGKEGLVYSQMQGFNESTERRKLSMNLL